jgi:hypothetical protein
MSFLKKLIFLFLIVFQNCFEYEETIYFKKGFQGVVEIQYTVPLHPKNDRSLIRFLPITQEDIEKRINKGLFNKNIKIRDFSVEVFEAPIWQDLNVPKPMFPKKAKVKYRIDFSELGKLDDVILGYLFVKRKGNSLNVRREFKSVLKTIDHESSPGEKKIHTETVRLLGDGYVVFRVLFSNQYECRSNRGEIGPGYIYYKLPLTETIEKPGLKSWDYTILAQ